MDTLEQVWGMGEGNDPEPELLAAVARGRVVRRLRESGVSVPTWISVVEVPGGSAVLVVHDPLRPRWTGYRAPSVEVGTLAARGILGGGGAFNW
jgi:hypothetical protein